MVLRGGIIFTQRNINVDMSLNTIAHSFDKSEYFQTIIFPHEQLSYRGQETTYLCLFDRDRPINRTYRLIAHSTSDFDDRLQFYKIDYFKVF